MAPLALVQGHQMAPLALGKGAEKNTVKSMVFNQTPLGFFPLPSLSYKFGHQIAPLP